MIDKLEFFLAVARQRNFRRAAEECGVTQPSLSAGIKQLEETLGVMLIRRSSQFQGLTLEGERVLEWARRLVGDARAMREEIRALKTGLSGVLRLAVIPSALPYTPTLTTAYRLLHPAVRMTILSRTSVDIAEMLGSLQADAGITYLDSEATGRLRSLPLYVEQYRLLTAGASFPHQVVTWAEVATLPLCLLTSDMQNPPDHRPLPGRRGAVGHAADDRVGLDDLAAVTRQARQLGDDRLGPRSRRCLPVATRSARSRSSRPRRACRSASWFPTVIPARRW